jgi:hypothetical protein
MTRSELLDRWVERRDQLKRYGALVDGARLVDDLITDLEQLLREEDADLLSLSEAAATSGYSADHLSRLIRTGKLENHGRSPRPRVRRGDLPRKPHALRPEPPSPFLTTSRRQIAMSVVNSETEEPR